MPYEIEVPGRAVVSFPDSVSHEEAQSILAKEFPPTGEDIAAKIADPSFKPTKDQFALYEQFKDQQSTDYLDGFVKAVPLVAEDIGKGATGAARAFLAADKSLAATGVEAFAQGSRNLYGMVAQSENPGSPLFKFKQLLTGTGSLEDRYNQFIEARNFAKDTAELESGQKTLIAKEGQIDPDAVKALSYALDPTLFFGPVKGLASAGHFGETAMKAAQAIGRVESVAGKAGAMSAEAAGRAAQTAGETVGGVGKAFGKAVDQVAQFTGIPKEQARVLVGGALGAGALSSPETLKVIAGTALAGGVLNRGGEILAEAAKVAQQGPSRLGTLERVAMSPNVSEPARKLASALAQAQPVYAFVGDVGKGAAEGVAIGSALGYLSTGTAEGAGAGGGSGAALGTIGGTIGSVINIPAKSQEGALADIGRFANTIPDPVLRSRVVDGLSRVAGEEKNWKRAAATVDALNTAQDRGIQVKFGDPESPAAFYNPKENAISLNPDKFNSESAVHELDHALRSGIIGKAYSEGLREAILGVRDQNGNTVKPGITDISGLADVSDNISEQYKTNPQESERFKQYGETLRSSIPENDKAEAIGSVIDELTAIYTGKLFTRAGTEDALTKRLPLFYRNLVDSVTQKIYDKFRTNLYERGTPIPVGKSIRYAFTDDKGRLIRIPELDALIEKAMQSTGKVEASSVSDPVPSDLDLSHRFVKTASGEYQERPKSEVEALGRKLYAEGLQRVSAVTSDGDPVLKSVSVGAGKGVSLRSLNEKQLMAFLNTNDLPARAKTQIYNDWKNLQNPDKGIIQDTVNYRINEEKLGGSKTYKELSATKTRDERLVHDIVLTPKRGVLQRGVNATRVRDALGRLIHDDRYSGLYSTPNDAIADLHKYLNNLTLGEGKAIPSATLFGGGIRGEKIRNMFHEAVGFPGDVPERPAGYDVKTAREKGNLPGQGVKHEDLNYYHIASSVPTGEKWNFLHDTTYKLGKINFQPDDYRGDVVGSTKVFTHKFGYRIVERDGRFTAYGKNDEKLGVFRSFKEANSTLNDQSNKENATRQRLLAEDYFKEHFNRNAPRKATEAGGGDRAVGSQEGQVKSEAVRQAGDVKFMPSDAEYLSAVQKGDTQTAQRMVDEAAKAAGKSSVDIARGSSGFREMAKEIDNLPDDAVISVFTATSPKTAESFLSEGVISEEKSYNLTGSFEPGRGLDRGLYVSDSPLAVEGYGRVILKVNVPKGRISPSTEGVRLGYNTTGLALGNSANGAVISGDISPSLISKWEGDRYDRSPIKISYPAITRDDSGNVIPLSQRFKATSEGSRFMPQPDSSMLGAYTFTGGYRAIPGKTNGSFRIYGPAGSLLGIASSLEEAQRMMKRRSFN